MSRLSESPFAACAANDVPGVRLTA